MCRVSAAVLLLSFVLACPGCGGRVNVEGLSDSQRTLYRTSAAEEVESQTRVKVRSFEF
jgi:hypothetical protein